MFFCIFICIFEKKSVILYANSACACAIELI